MPLAYVSTRHASAYRRLGDTVYDSRFRQITVDATDIVSILARRLRGDLRRAAYGTHVSRASLSFDISQLAAGARTSKQPLAT